MLSLRFASRLARVCASNKLSSRNSSWLTCPRWQQQNCVISKAKPSRRVMAAAGAATDGSVMLVCRAHLLYQVAA